MTITLQVREMEQWVSGARFLTSQSCRLRGRFKIPGNSNLNWQWLLPNRTIKYFTYGIAFNHRTSLSGKYHHFPILQMRNLTLEELSCGQRAGLSRARSAPRALCPQLWRWPLHTCLSLLSMWGSACARQHPTRVEWWMSRGSEWMNGDDGSYKKDVGEKEVKLGCVEG